MKFTLTREHTCNPEKYEALKFGGTITADTEVDREYRDLGADEAGLLLDEAMDLLLAPSVDRAVQLGGQMEESHIIDYYEIDN